MSNQLNHDRLIAKLQHFADSMNQTVIEKEFLSLTLEQSESKSNLRNEILIYHKIIDDYYSEFDDILCK